MTRAWSSSGVNASASWIRSTVAVLGGLDQIVLGQLKPFCDSLAGFSERALGGIQIRVRGGPADCRRRAAAAVCLAS